MRTRKPNLFVTLVSAMALLLAFMAPSPASAQVVGADICLLVDLNRDGVIVEAEVSAALLNPEVLALLDVEAIANLLGGS